MISDFTKRGQRFIETAMYQECLRKLNSARSLVISGNPGEGKSRYAIELMCSKTQQGRRLFLTSAKQLENIDLEHIDGVIIDNIYGDVSFDEDKYKRWKEQMPYLIARCKNNPFYVIVTSRSYILKSSTDQEIQCMDNVELLTTGLAMEERVSILQSHCSIEDPHPLIAAFKSPIGLPQICYMYSTSDKFCKEDIFHHPEVFIKNILRAFELEDRMLLTALALVVFHSGTLVISDIRNDEFDKINDYIKPNTTRYDVKMALDKLCGSFIQYNETNDTYQFVHDSLFETCCSYIGGRHSELFISLSDVRVLIEFARIQNQVETADRIYAHIPNNRKNIKHLVARYISAMQEDPRLKVPLTSSDALFCEDLLSEVLSNLEDNNMISLFLNVADENESLLVEFCNMDQPQLITYVIKAIDKYAAEDWVKSQKREAQIRCKRWGFIACLESLQTDEEFSSENSFDASSDESTGEWYGLSVLKLRNETKIEEALQRGDEKALRKLVDKGILSESELCNIIKVRIEKGKEAGICFETDPHFTNQLIRHAVRFTNTSQFVFFMKRAIASRMSIEDNSLISDASLDNDIEHMVQTIDNEVAHFVILYCFVNRCWKPLWRLFEMEVPCSDIVYIYEMRKFSERFSILSADLQDILADTPKVIHLLRLEHPNLITECIQDFCRCSNPHLFSATVKSAIANLLSVQDHVFNNYVCADFKRMRELADQDDLHLLALCCVVNNCLEPLMHFLDIDIPLSDIEYVHGMRHISERFRIVSDFFSDILRLNSKDIKIIHFVRFARPTFQTELLRNSLQRKNADLFSVVMKSAITHRLSIDDNSVAASVDYHNIERMSKLVNHEDVHLLALYFVVNDHFGPLLDLLEIEIPLGDIEYICYMKDVSERFKILSDHFAHILSKRLECLRVIHIVLLERPDLTFKCKRKSISLTSHALRVLTRNEEGYSQLSLVTTIKPY